MLITNTTARLICIARVDILPGAQVEIDKSFDEAVRNSPAFKVGWLKEGSVEMPTPIKGSKPNTLTGLDQTQAMALVRMESDFSQLQTWAKDETRKDILAAIGLKTSLNPVKK